MTTTIRTALPFFLTLAACSAGASDPQSTSVASAEHVVTNGPEEAKLLAGQPSIGFLPTGFDVNAVRTQFGADAVSPGVLVLDAKAGATPPNWRATDALDTTKLAGVNTTGLDTLHVAGSGQYDAAQLATPLALAQQLGKKLVVLHLREEPTGFVANEPFSMYGFVGTNVTDWSNAGLDDDLVEKRNEAIVKAVAQAPSVVLYDKAALKTAIKAGSLPTAKPIAPTNVTTEKEIVEAAGADFEHVAITDHGRPSVDAVDDIVEVLTDATSDGKLLYTHCAGGDGRTTTVMAMADMLQNASKGVSFTDILKRQAAIGGEDMTITSDPGAKGQLQKDRLAFLQQFYSYAQANPTGATKFSDWAEANAVPAYTPSYGN